MSGTYEYPEEVVRARNEERRLLLEVVDAARRFEMFAHLATAPKDSVGYEAFTESRNDLRAALACLDTCVCGERLEDGECHSDHHFDFAVTGGER